MEPIEPDAASAPDANMSAQGAGGAFVSVTRFRARSVWALPTFAFHAQRAIAQLGRADGYLGGAVRQDEGLVFWTMTLWRDALASRAYAHSGAHLKAMPRLQALGDEASTVHWFQAGTELPDWPGAERRLQTEGFAIPLRHPSPHHRAGGYEPSKVRLMGRL